MPACEGFQGVYERRVEWGDCDPAGIVYYPNYYRWFDNAGHRLLAAAGYTLERMRGRYGAVGFPLVHTGAAFRKPSRAGDLLRIESRVAAVTRKTIRVEHEVYLVGELVVEGEETRVFGVFDEDGVLRAKPLPDELRQALGFGGNRLRPDQAMTGEIRR